LRSRSQYEELKQVRAYCDRFGIGQDDKIDRRYSLNERFYSLVEATGEEGMLTRYLKANGSGEIFS